MTYTSETVIGNRAEAIAYLTKNGVASVPRSRYGRDTLECAIAAWQAALIVAVETGEQVFVRDLDYAMSLAVNDSPDIEYLVRDYGHILTEHGEAQDTCDRCGKRGVIHVGWETETGFDGLCDDCLDSRGEAE